MVEHVTNQEQIAEGLESGDYFKGVIRINPKFRHRAYVSIEGFPNDVLIEGDENINRAMDGDEVIISLE
jgi:hypothetical protein